MKDDPIRLVDVFRVSDPAAMWLSEAVVRKGIIVTATRVGVSRWRVKYDDMDFPIYTDDIVKGNVERLTPNSIQA